MSGKQYTANGLRRCAFDQPSGYALMQDATPNLVYRFIPDDEAAKHGYVRVIDESGKDYAYTTDRFFPLEVPQALGKTLSLAS